MAARSSVELTKVVLSPVPDKLAAAPETKPVPMIVIGKYGPPASIGSGDAPVMTGGVAADAPARRIEDSQTMRRVMDSRPATT
jgi:hypothetical protein